MGRDTRGTLVIISPGEKFVLKLPVSGLIVAGVLFFVAMAVLGILVLRKPTLETPQTIADISRDNVVLSANLDAVTEEIRELLRVNNIFSAELEQALSAIYPGASTLSNQAELNSGFVDTAQLFGLASHSTRLQQDIQKLSASFRTAAPAVGQIRDTLAAQRQLLRSIPTTWPVIGGRMGLTMEYGPRVHPITGAWYMHKGADIAGPAGTPIIAAADGVVVKAENDQRSGYGYMVVIEHSYGFSTLYAHMRTFPNVRAGQTVRQGQLIGSMGDTGLATGVHLHYEIKVGEEVLDPTTYLAIRNNFIRWEMLQN